MTRKLMFLLVAFLFIPSFVFAQFGKNKVGGSDDVRYIETPHFKIYHWMDTSDSNQRFHLEEMTNQLEGSYEFISDTYQHPLSEKIIVIIHKTHKQFEANRVDSSGGFLPESVGAFAEPIRNRMVLKLDFLPPLNRTIVTHELEHIFYFDMAKLGLLGGVFSGHPSFFVEGVRADFMANWYSPYTRDDIRRMIQRGIASGPNMYLPTWDMMMSGRCSFPRVCNPYIVGAMVAEFIRDKFGEDAVLRFIKEGTSAGGGRLMEVLYGITGGVINRSNFDQMHRDYWSERYQRDMLDKQRPYQTTSSFIGRSITPEESPYYTLSPVVSPDGERLSCFTIGDTGVTIVSFPIGNKPVLYSRRNPDIYSVDEKDNGNTQEDSREDNHKVLYDKLPPRPYEYLISQGLITWPFNGFDLDWDRNGNTLVFFARKDDHVLVLMDAETGKIQREVELPLDQGFSPSFSPSGKVVYFSASKNVTRDIYAYDLERNVLMNVTDDLAFDTAPVISPDGTRLIYVSFTGDFQKLFMINLTSKVKTQLTFNRYNDSSPSWSDDGQYVVYTSDEPMLVENKNGANRNGMVWNLYTMNIETREISQWTDFFGGVFTPRFARDNNKKIYYVAYWQYDQIYNTIVPNFKLYEASLKEPIRTFLSIDNDEPNYWAFRRTDLFKIGLDENQVINPLDAPKSWQLMPRGSYFGYNTYWGAFANSGFDLNSILGDERHSALFAYNGSFFRYVDYSYLNQRKRLQWGAFISDYKYPLYYAFRDIVKQNPEQPILNQTAMEKFEIGAIATYPINKFTRLEGSFRIRNTSFDTFLASGQGSDLSTNDTSLLDFFGRSNRHSNLLSGAFIRDTVLYSGYTQGPWHGNALRLEFEIAPPSIGNSANYVSFNIDARKYMRISPGSLLALRSTVMWNSNANGNFILMGGTNTLRGYPYGSLIGNRAVYTSAELRFPILDGIVFPKGIGVGPFRGLAFIDVGATSFSNNDLPDQKGLSYGSGIQLNFFMPMNFVWTKTDWHGYDRWRSDFYISTNW
jgi:Tol biopolymer transport system component